MIFQSYSYLNLPKGKHGLIDPKGNFIPYGDAGNLCSYEEQIKVFVREQLKVDIISCYQKKKEQVPSNLYFFRHNIYDYKALLLDFLGYCNYETYPSSDAVIELPMEEINGKKVTNEQIRTLEELIKINKNKKEAFSSIKQLILRKK